MTPILFPHSATTFTTNGTGRLVDAISCVVTEERNGIYELEMRYPVTGKWFTELLQMGIIVVIHDDNHDLQPFDIYKISAPLDGIVTVYAHHISYRLNNVMVRPFTATSARDAMEQLRSHAFNTMRFTYSTDKTVGSPYELSSPRNARSVLLGEENSLLDVYGKSDFKFDLFHVYMLQNRGTATGVTVRYGKNMTGLVRERDVSGTFSAVCPYWTDGEESVYLPEIIVRPTVPISPMVPVTMDFSDQFEEKPTEQQLREKAQAWLDTNQPWLGTDTITIDFTALWQTPEYKDYAAIQRVGLCDTVSVYYTDMGIISEDAKIVRVVFDVLTERYNELTLGTIVKKFVAITGSGSLDVNISAIANRVAAQIGTGALTSSDDGAGNVTLKKIGISATSSGNNVTITG